MNILHITKVKNWNGEVQQLYTLVVELNRRGEVDVCILCPNQSEIHKKLRNTQIKTVTFDDKDRKSYKLANVIYKLKKEHGFDLIHLHSSSLLLAAILYYSVYDKETPFILAKKSMIRTSSFLSQLKYNHKVIKKIICVSEAVKSTLDGFIWKKNAHKIGVLYDGIDPETCKRTQPFSIRHKYNLKETDFIVGNIANHTPAKELETFVETVNHIVKTLGIKEIKFVQIGGEFKYSKPIYDLAKKYNLVDNLIFMGFHEEASNLLDQFDVMLMTSKREGLPLTIYESFANKIPVVATKAGGIPEAIEHEHTGLLSTIGDYKSLATNVLRIKEDLDLRKRIVNEAEALFYNKFTQSVMGQKTYEIYLDCIKNDKS